MDIGVRSILFCSIVSIKHHLEYLGGCIFSKFELKKTYILFSPSSEPVVFGDHGVWREFFLDA
jgi:hypothetical protein